MMIGLFALLHFQEVPPEIPKLLIVANSSSEIKQFPEIEDP